MTRSSYILKLVCCYFCISILICKSNKFRVVSIQNKLRKQIENIVSGIMVSSGSLLLSTSSILSIPSIAHASKEEDLPILDNNIIQNRISFKEYNVFRPGKENGDIFYPAWYVCALSYYPMLSCAT